MVTDPPLASEDATPPLPAAASPPPRAPCHGCGIAVAAVSTGDRGATVGTDVDRRLVGDRAAIDRDVAAVRVADHDRVAHVPTGVDVADAHRPAVGLGHRDPAVAGRRVAIP